MKPRGNKGIGAVVIGGDYQGLGIVRSLGRQGVPVHVIDDEHSIARFSRYTSSALRVPDLRAPENTLQALLRLGRLNELNGCVLYPTRDETVAVLSQHRSQLSQYFRVPTPGWETIRWIWDKRNTYQIAEKLGIPTPRTWLFRNERNLADIDGHLPVAIKPAIKEHFVYATGDKCWRANTPLQLRQLFTRAQRYVPADEIMLQDIIPGMGRTNSPIVPSSKKAGGWLASSFSGGGSIRSNSDAPALTLRALMYPKWNAFPCAFCPRLITTVLSKLNLSAIRAMASIACST